MCNLFVIELIDCLFYFISLSAQGGVHCKRNRCQITGHQYLCRLLWLPLDCNRRFLDFYLAYDFKLDSISIGNQAYPSASVHADPSYQDLIDHVHTLPGQKTAFGKFYIPSMLVFSQFAYLIGKDQGFITVFICISRDMGNCFIFVRCAL